MAVDVAMPIIAGAAVFATLYPYPPRPSTDQTNIMRDRASSGVCRGLPEGHRMRIARVAACPTAPLAFATTATAQTTPARSRGAIIAVDGNVITIAARESDTVKVTVVDIKENSVVGVASLDAPSGQLEWRRWSRSTAARP